jgi:hypothetical protein
LNSFYGICGCGTEYRFGALPGEKACGDIFEAMARIAPSQPNKAMARIAPLQPNQVMARIAPRRNGAISLGPCCRVEIPEHDFLD